MKLLRLTDVDAQSRAGTSNSDRRRWHTNQYLSREKWVLMQLGWLASRFGEHYLWSSFFSDLFSIITCMLKIYIVKTLMQNDRTIPTAAGVGLLRVTHGKAIIFNINFVPEPFFSIKRCKLAVTSLAFPLIAAYLISASSLCEMCRSLVSRLLEEDFSLQGESVTTSGCTVDTLRGSTHPTTPSTASRSTQWKCGEVGQQQNFL